MRNYSERGLTPKAKILALTERSGACWLWLGRIDRDGYAELKLGGRAGKRHRAHRVSYEEFVGPVPPDLELDHTCRVRRCVNPGHLDPVSGAENLRRAAARRVNA